ELKKIGRPAYPALLRAWEKKSTGETRGRLQQLLAAINRLPLSPASVRLIRAVEALEAMGTAEARDCLASMARKAEDNLLRREAQISVDRLARRATRAAVSEPS